MKIGNIDITRAYFGSLELNSSNAYVGEFKVIEGEEPAWDGLTFTALQDNSTINMSHFGTNASTTTPVLEYSRDGEIWTPWFFETLTVNKGEHIYFRGNNPNGIGKTYSYDYSTFDGTGQFSLEGNIMSILYASDYNERFVLPVNYCFHKIFYFNRSIIDASMLLLPATTLSNNCYRSMFAGCDKLINAPELPATTLKDYCYALMFNYCDKLINAPELPATSLANRCYHSMFTSCHSLTYVKHHITNWNNTHTTNWLSGVGSSGIVECPAASTIPSDTPNGIPSGWTRINF